MNPAPAIIQFKSHVHAYINGEFWEKLSNFMALFTFGNFTQSRIPHNDFLDPFNDILLIRRCRDVEV